MIAALADTLDAAHGSVRATPSVATKVVLPTAICAAMVLAGLQPFWPHPHQDPDFIESAVMLRFDQQLISN